MRRPLLSLLLAGALGACAVPGDRVLILDRIAAGGELALTEVQLTGLVDLDRLEGARVRLFGGATLQVDPTNPTADRGASRSAWVQDGGAVRLRWVDDGGVAVPADFDSLCMTTAYAHVERVADRLAALGVGSAADQAPLFYHPRVEQSESEPFPTTDNALYLPEADGFVLLPMRILRDIPFAMNPGVLAHEYAHRVFYYELWGGQMFAAIAEHQGTPGSLNAWNRLRATDEGVADYIGAYLTDDPDFLAKSAPAEIAAPRSLRGAWVLEPSWVNGLEPTTDEDEYARYLPGSVVAAALWRLGQLAGHDAVAAALVDAERQLRATVLGSFDYRFGELEALVIGALPSGERAAACQALADAYAAVWSTFAAVCP